jgi:hypothetical protein
VKVGDIIMLKRTQEPTVLPYCTKVLKIWWDYTGELMVEILCPKLDGTSQQVCANLYEVV